MEKSGEQIKTSHQDVPLRLTIQNISKLQASILSLSEELQGKSLSGLPAELVKLFPKIVASIGYLRTAADSLEKIIAGFDQNEKNVFLENAQELFESITTCWDLKELANLEGFTLKFSDLKMYSDAKQFLDDYRLAEDLFNDFFSLVRPILSKIKEKNATGKQVVNERLEEKILSFTNFIRSLSALLRRISNQKYEVQRYLEIDFILLHSTQRRQVQSAQETRSNLSTLLNTSQLLSPDLWRESLLSLPIGSWCINLNTTLIDLRLFTDQVLLNPFCNLLQSSNDSEPVRLNVKDFLDHNPLIFPRDESYYFAKCLFQFLARNKFLSDLSQCNRLIDLVQDQYQQRVATRDILLTRLLNNARDFHRVESTLISADELLAKTFDLLLSDFSRFIRYSNHLINYAEFVFIAEFFELPMELPVGSVAFIPASQRRISDDDRRNFLSLFTRTDLYIIKILNSEHDWYDYCMNFQSSGRELDSEIDKIRTLRDLLSMTLDHIRNGRHETLLQQLPQFLNSRVCDGLDELDSLIQEHESRSSPNLTLGSGKS